MHLSDAVLESVMVFRLGAGAVAEVVVPLCLAKAGFFSGCTVVCTSIYIVFIPAASSKIRVNLGLVVVIDLCIISYLITSGSSC